MSLNSSAGLMPAGSSVPIAQTGFSKLNWYRIQASYSSGMPTFSSSGGDGKPKSHDDCAARQAGNSGNRLGSGTHHDEWISTLLPFDRSPGQLVPRNVSRYCPESGGGAKPTCW